MILPLKNYHLAAIAKVLNYPMNFQTGRIKNRIMSLFAPKIKAKEASRIEIIEAFCRRDADNKPIYVKNDKNQDVYDLTPENLEKYNAEHKALINEPCPVDFPESMKLDVGPFKMFINNSPIELSAIDQAIIEEVMTAIDEMAAEIKKA